MKGLIERYKERFHNRGASQYIGLKITGLVVMVAILVFIVVLIFGELTASAAELPQLVSNAKVMI